MFEALVVVTWLDGGGLFGPVTDHFLAHLLKTDVYGFAVLLWVGINCCTRVVKAYVNCIAFWLVNVKNNLQNLFVLHVQSDTRREFAT